MENKSNKSLLIILAVFVVLMIGAYLLYDQLGDSFGQGNLVIKPTETDADTSGDDTGTETQPGTDSSDQSGTDSGTDGSTDSAESEPMMAPDFTVYDRSGNKVNLSDFIGKPVIVNFWASWCSPCKAEMPDFEEAYKEYGEQIHFLMINSTDGSRETLETAKVFIHKEGYTFPVYFDKDSDAAITYGVNSIPMTFFIDAEGHAVAYGQGTLDRATLQVGIEMILK